MPVHLMQRDEPSPCLACLAPCLAALSVAAAGLMTTASTGRPSLLNSRHEHHLSRTPSRSRIRRRQGSQATLSALPPAPVAGGAVPPTPPMMAC